MKNTDTMCSRRGKLATLEEIEAERTPNFPPIPKYFTAGDCLRQHERSVGGGTFPPDVDLSPITVTKTSESFKSSSLMGGPVVWVDFAALPPRLLPDVEVPQEIASTIPRVLGFDPPAAREGFADYLKMVGRLCAK